MLIYLKTFPFITFSCVYKPDNLKNYERKVIECINVLLLSRDTKYSKDCRVDPLKIVKYLQKQNAKMDPEHLKGMQNTLELLNDAKTFLSDSYPSFKQSKEFFHKLFKLTPLISSAIQSARQHKNWFIRECLTRFVSLGLSLTCAIDIIAMIFIDIPAIFIFALLDIPRRHPTLTPCFADTLKFSISHIRDILIKSAGALSGSAIGIIHPDTALKLTDPTSSFYKKIRFKDELPLETPIERFNQLKNDDSLLVPICYQTPENSSHIVYCLISKDDDKYTMSILNKGFGSENNTTNYTVMSLLILKKEITPEIEKKILEQMSSKKQITNTTYDNLPEQAVKIHLESLIKFQTTPYATIEANSKEKNITPSMYLSNKLSPPALKADGEFYFRTLAPVDEDCLPQLENNPKLLMNRT